MVPAPSGCNDSPVQCGSRNTDCDPSREEISSSQLARIFYDMVDQNFRPGPRNWIPSIGNKV